MGTSRCWQDNVVNGFGQRKTKTTVVSRKKNRRLMVRAIVKKLKAAGKPINLQDINEEVLNMFRRKRQGQKNKQITPKIK